MTYPTTPEPSEVELAAHQDPLADAYAPQLACGLDGPEVVADVQSIPDVALEDGFIYQASGDWPVALIVPDVALEEAGPSHEIMAAILGLARDTLRRTIWQEVLNERSSQLTKWGDQSRPLGASATWSKIADIHRDNCNEAAAEGVCTWRHIALEEVFEAFSEPDRDAFRKEAIQTIAVLLSALEDLYREEFE